MNRNYLAVAVVAALGVAEAIGFRDLRVLGSVLLGMCALGACGAAAGLAYGLMHRLGARGGVWPHVRWMIAGQVGTMSLVSILSRVMDEPSPPRRAGERVELLAIFLAAGAVIGWTVGRKRVDGYFGR